MLSTWKIVNFVAFCWVIWFWMNFWCYCRQLSSAWIYTYCNFIRCELLQLLLLAGWLTGAVITVVIISSVLMTETSTAMACGSRSQCWQSAWSGHHWLDAARPHRPGLRTSVAARQVSILSLIMSCLLVQLAISHVLCTVALSRIQFSLSSDASSHLFAFSSPCIPFSLPWIISSLALSFSFAFPAFTSPLRIEFAVFWSKPKISCCLLNAVIADTMW